jgi:hypothetical protein
MTVDEMNLDDFDSEPVEVAVPPDRAALEIEQTDRMRRYRSVRELIVSPEVAQALRDGYTAQEIADVLQVSVQSVYKHMKSAEMGVLIDRESRRVLRHLTRRKLDSEKYRDLALALGVLIDKARLLRNEPTSIVRNEGESVDRLAVLLFGAPGSSGGRAESNPVIEIAPERGADSLPGLHDALEPSGSTENGGSDLGSDKP